MMPSAPATVRERVLEETALFVVAELPEAVPVLELLAEVIVAELLDPPVADAPAAVDVRTGVEVSVTPTASQICFAVLTAVVRSLPEHLEYMQSVTLETNAWFLHVHKVSVATHPPRLAFVRQVVAQDGKGD